MKSQVKNKRNMREASTRDPFANSKGTGPIMHTPGTKPARKAKNYVEEQARKHSKKDLHEASKHMKEHMR
jgi:hypothetical protein